jgi:ABC-2 type transport system permease protein
MNRAWPIARKELDIYFFSPIAYIILFAFTLISGYYFYIFIFETKDAVQIIPLLCNLLVFITMFMTPFLTMRLVAEERRSGTLEILATSPVTEMDIILGKFIGVLLFFLILTGLIIVDSLILLLFGKPDIGMILSNYLGLILAGGAFLSLGLLASTLGRNQIVSAMLAFLLVLFFWLIGWIGGYLGGFLKTLFQYLSITDHFGNFNKGLLDSTDLVFFLSFIFFNLFLSARIIRTRR